MMTLCFFVSIDGMGVWVTDELTLFVALVVVADANLLATLQGVVDDE